ncbi:MAG: glycosyltransferase family 9 protein [Elusimicrobiota bacterium]
MKMIPKNAKFVIFRTDRIGDVMLSVPVAEALKKCYPGSRITFVAREYTKQLFINNPFVDKVIAIDSFTKKEFYQYLKNEKFDAAIVLYSELRIAWPIFKARIPIRVGPMSKWWGIFFNRRVWQKRSESFLSEAEYNLKLLEAVGCKETAYPILVLSDDEKLWRDRFLDALNIGSKKLVIIHPGSGHSARNWPLKKFLDLAVLLKRRDNIKIIITGTHDEYMSCMSLAKELPLTCEDFLKDLPLRQFLALLSRADCLLTNSTGPLHCGAALNAATISFYCPIRVCNPRRWGPYVKDHSRHFVFMPPVPECEKCLGRECEYYNCMDMILVEDVEKKLDEMIR